MNSLGYERFQQFYLRTFSEDPNPHWPRAAHFDFRTHFSEVRDGVLDRFIGHNILGFE